MNILFDTKYNTAGSDFLSIEFIVSHIPFKADIYWELASKSNITLSTRLNTNSNNLPFMLGSSLYIFSYASAISTNWRVELKKASEKTYFSDKNFLLSSWTTL